MSKFFSRLVGSYKPEDRLIVLDLETLDAKRTPNCAAIVVEIKRKDRHIRSGELKCTKETKFPAQMAGQIAMTSVFFLDGAKCQAKDLELSIVALSPGEGDLQLGDTKFDISKYCGKQRQKLSLPIRDNFFNLTMHVSVVKMEEGVALGVNVAAVIESENMKRQSKIDPNLVAALKQQQEQKEQQAELAKQREADIEIKKRQSVIVQHVPSSADLEESKSQPAKKNAVEATLLAEVQKLKDGQWEQKQQTENANKTVLVQTEKISNMDRALKELTGENAEQTEKIQALEQELMEMMNQEGEVKTVIEKETVTVVTAADTKHFDEQIEKLNSDHQVKDTKIQELEKELEANKADSEASSAAQATELAASNEKLSAELEEIKKAHGVASVEEAVEQAAQREVIAKELDEVKSQHNEAQVAIQKLEAELDAVKAAGSESTDRKWLKLTDIADQIYQEYAQDRQWAYDEVMKAADMEEAVAICAELRVKKHTLEEQAYVSKAREENTLLLCEQSNKLKEEMAELVVANAAATLALIAQNAQQEFGLGQKAFDKISQAKTAEEAQAMVEEFRQKKFLAYDQEDKNQKDKDSMLGTAEAEVKSKTAEILVLAAAVAKAESESHERKEHSEKMEKELADAKHEWKTQEDSLREQIVGHAGESADLERALSDAKKQLAASEAKLESETAQTSTFQEAFAAQQAQISQDQAAHQEAQSKFDTALAEIEQLQATLEKQNAETATRDEEAAGKDAAHEQAMEELKGQQAEVLESQSAKIQELEAQAEKFAGMGEMEAQMAAMQADAEEKAKEFESVLARLHYFEEEKKRNSSASAMFKQQQEKEKAEKSFLDKIKIQERKIDSLEGESEHSRDEVKALKKTIKEHESKMKEAGIEI